MRGKGDTCMFGRIRQARSLEEYQDTLHWSPFVRLEVADGPQHNIAPGSQPIALHRLGPDGSDGAARLHWGYRPPWYKRRSHYVARLESMLRGSRIWHPLLRRRIIVPADGWYEWAGAANEARPWYVSACDEQPVCPCRRDCVGTWAHPLFGSRFLTDYRHRRRYGGSGSGPAPDLPWTRCGAGLARLHAGNRRSRGRVGRTPCCR